MIARGRSALQARLEAGQERGAILVFAALLLVVLFGFAALGVDATHAFAETRQAQSAADAAALAAGLEFLSTSSPSNTDLFNTVKAYTDTNWGWKAPTVGEWSSCSDSAKPSDYAPIQDTSVSPATTISDCISIKQVNGEPALLRVKLPEHAMQTTFAQILGFTEVDITAVATVEIQYQENTKVLPFSVPVDADGEECISTPPSGLLPEDPSIVCDGPTQGNFGMIDSPFFGAGDPHFTLPVSCPSSPNFNSGVATHNTALGIDHPIRPSPTPPSTLGQDAGPNPLGGDNCTSAANGDVPWILRTETGNTVTSGNPSIMEIGFLGEASQTSPQTAASVVGRLRQTSSVPSSGLVSASGQRITFRTLSGNYTVDNVGLWEYLEDNGTNGVCDKNSYTSLTGRDLTTRFMQCLATNPSGQLFVDEILEAPRFAVVPRLNYLDGSNFGSKWWDIISMDPVYLWATWYDCTNGSDNECLFYPDNFTGDPMDRDSYSLLHVPGEGSAEPCYLDSSSVCTTPSASRFSMQGISALILDWNWFPPGAENQFGGNIPFEIFLHENE